MKTGKKEWLYFSPRFEYEKEFGDLSSAWEGHRYFIYDFIRNTKPKLIVELGTYKGGSLFAMAQAIKDSGLQCKLLGVDTWKGDRHTGFYGNQVFSLVNEIKRKIYNDQNIVLKKKSFDMAITRIKNGTVDILHIDGLHTYKAVKHDFKNWRVKVKKDGVILFHDIQEKKGDFQVYRLWNELKKKFDYLDFYHSHGLGLIFLNENNDNVVRFREIWRKYYSLQYKYSLSRKQASKELIKINFLLEINSQLKSEKINLLSEVLPLRNEVEELINSRFFRLWQNYNKLKKKIFATL